MPGLSGVSELKYRLACSRERELFNVDHDVGIIREIRSHLAGAMERADTNRTLVTLSASPHSASKLRGTLPRLFNQADDAGIELDLFIGLNDNAPHGALIFELLGNRAELHDLVTCDQLRDDQGFDLLFPDGQMAGDPYLAANGLPGAHRVHIVHQVHTPTCKGKNRVLKAICDGVLDSIDAGVWQNPPAQTLHIDDESRLYADEDLDSNGLRVLHDEFTAGKHQVLGARMRTVPYGPDPTDPLAAAPRPLEDVHNAYRFIDCAQTDVTPVPPGAATLGETDVLLAARWPISHRYIGSRNDDTHTAMYLNALKVPYGISRRVTVFNEARNSPEQLRRWIRANAGLVHQFGSNYKSLIKIPFGSPRLWSYMTSDIVELLKDGREHPDSLTGDCDW